MVPWGSRWYASLELRRPQSWECVAASALSLPRGTAHSARLLSVSGCGASARAVVLLSFSEQPSQEQLSSPWDKVSQILALKTVFQFGKSQVAFYPYNPVRVLSHRSKSDLICVSSMEWGLWAVLLAVWDYVGEKWLIAFFHLPTADLSRCDVFHLVNLEMLQNCSLWGFGTAGISLEKPTYLQIAKKEKLLEGNGLFTAVGL